MTVPSDGAICPSAQDLQLTDPRFPLNFPTPHLVHSFLVAKTFFTWQENVWNIIDDRGDEENLRRKLQKERIERERIQTLRIEAERIEHERKIKAALRRIHRNFKP